MISSNADMVRHSNKTLHLPRLCSVEILFVTPIVVEKLLKSKVNGEVRREESVQEPLMSYAVLFIDAWPRRTRDTLKVHLKCLSRSRILTNLWWCIYFKPKAHTPNTIRPRISKRECLYSWRCYCQHILVWRHRCPLTQIGTATTSYLLWLGRQQQVSSTLATTVRYGGT